MLNQGGAHAQVAALLMAALRPCLMGACSYARAASSHLLSCLCSSCSPALLKQLIEADLCEYLFECLRGSVASAARGSKASSPEAAATLAALWSLAHYQGKVLANQLFVLCLHLWLHYVPLVTSGLPLPLPASAVAFNQHALCGVEVLIQVGPATLLQGCTPLLTGLTPLCWVAALTMTHPLTCVGRCLKPPPSRGRPRCRRTCCYCLPPCCIRSPSLGSSLQMCSASCRR